VRYAYTGNVHDPRGNSTWCHHCGELLIERDWHQLGDWRLTGAGRCPGCDAPLPGVFESEPGDWGNKRRPLRFARQ
jgi:pyruvate formate lyase activating enzyme